MLLCPFAKNGNFCSTLEEVGGKISPSLALNTIGMAKNVCLNLVDALSGLPQPSERGHATQSRHL